MASPTLIGAYKKISRCAEMFHCIPHYFDAESKRIEPLSGWRGHLVYCNNFAATAFTVFLFAQYFTATDLISWNRGMMFSLLSLTLSVICIANLFIFQNIFLGQDTNELWNLTFHFLQEFNGNQL